MLLGIVGKAALFTLLVIITASCVFNLWAIRRKNHSAVKGTRRFNLAQFLLAGLASACLVALLVTENFHYAYVAEYTGPQLALIYRIAAFWGGNAGSLLLWTLVLTLYSAVISYAKHVDDHLFLPVVSLVMSCVTLFYVVVITFAANPFTYSTHALPPSGLNPLLQNAGMTVHPVNLYLGFVGFTVPFAYAMAALWLKRTDATWLRITRRWTLVSWLFLSIGIVYGAHWSYEELGWGGYWAWDPVENASLLPWLTGTAFLHCAIVQEKRGMLKGWNIILIALTFQLTILGTFLTRSGILWSIHAFANSILGNYFFGFLCITLIGAAALIVRRWKLLKADRPFEAVVSKETGFLLNNILFLGSAFAVLWGTIFPIVSEGLTGHRMMVSAPFYNKVNLPLGVCILLLMAVGPGLAWRKASLKQSLVNLLLPFVLAVLCGVLVTQALHGAYQKNSALGMYALIAAFFAVFMVLKEFIRAVIARMRVTKEPVYRSFIRLVSKNRRRYGGYVVHLAIALMAAGIAGSGTFHIDLQQQLTPGESTVVGNYQITFEGMGVAAADGNRTMYANLEVKQGGKPLGIIRPSAVFYSNGQEPTTDVSIYSQPLRDLYVVMLGTANGDSAVFDFHVNPLVQFIWYGGYLFIAGTILGLWPERARKVHAAAYDIKAELYQSLVDLEYDMQMAKITQSDYQRLKSGYMSRLSQLETLSIEVEKRLKRELEHALVGNHEEESAGGLV